MILSLLSAITATLFFVGGIYCLTRSRKQMLNIFSALVMFCLGWWSFCNFFFFTAPTETAAWFWHHMASLGWTGFIAETTYYFIVLTGVNKRFKKVWIQILFYLLPVILLVQNIFGSKTSLAVALTKSKIGNIWTYVNSADNIWLWLYILCLCVYFGFSFSCLIHWEMHVQHRLKKRMAIGFVIIDMLTILMGLITDVIVPLYNQSTPPVANLCTALFGTGYFLIIVRYDMFNVSHVVKEREILEHSMEAILVTDEFGEILDANSACEKLFSLDKNKLIGSRLQTYFENDSYREKIMTIFDMSDFVDDIELYLTANKDMRKSVLISGSVLRNKRREYIGTVVSLRDISQLNALKEKYRIASDRYEKLAYYDALTGLPNRRKTFEVLAELSAAYDKSKKDFFILYMDVDRFKSINDIYGHQTGDMFLIEVSKRLKECLNSSITFVGRLGGDELLVIGGEDTSSEKSDENKRRISGAFEKEFIINDFRIKSDVSIGFARYSDYEDIDLMVHYADDEMYAVKNKKHREKDSETENTY